MKARVKGNNESFVAVTNLQLENHAEVYHPEDLEFEPSTNAMLNDLVIGKHTYTTEDFKKIKEATDWWDWEKFRREAAMRAMQGMLVSAKRPNGADDFHYVRYWLVSDAVSYADALIKELKEK